MALNSFSVRCRAQTEWSGSGMRNKNREKLIKSYVLSMVNVMHACTIVQYAAFVLFGGKNSLNKSLHLIERPSAACATMRVSEWKAVAESSGNAEKKTIFARPEHVLFSTCSVSLAPTLLHFEIFQPEGGEQEEARKNSSCWININPRWRSSPRILCNRIENILLALYGLARKRSRKATTTTWKSTGVTKRRDFFDTARSRPA